ncbi:MAG: ABC transporter ATP-binding protein [Bacilli bacterium]
MKIISCKNLVKNYQNAKVLTKVLNNIDLTIEQGEFCGITGPSGSGKTTLLYTLSGLEKLTSGDLFLFEKNINEYTNNEIADMRKNQIGFVFQFYNLIPNLTAFENIKLAQIIAKCDDDEKVLNALKMVEMAEFKDYFPNELSGGMQQRVAIARCLVNEPTVIFADEPTGNLDQKNGQEIMNIFQKLNQQQGITIVLVTHSEDNLHYCTRHIKLTDGKIIHDEKLTV